MSQSARDALVKPGAGLVFQRDSQKTDLDTIGVTQTSLIALLLELTAKGFYIELTAVKSDHSNDSALGEHSHYNGFCVDCWPLASNKPGDYLSPASVRFGEFLKACAASPWLHQIGLAGSADTVTNHAAAGPTVFDDDGADHVHLGAV